MAIHCFSWSNSISLQFTTETLAFLTHITERDMQPLLPVFVASRQRRNMTLHFCVTKDSNHRLSKPTLGCLATAHPTQTEYATSQEHTSVTQQISSILDTTSSFLQARCHASPIYLPPLGLHPVHLPRSYCIIPVTASVSSCATDRACANIHLMPTDSS